MAQEKKHKLITIVLLSVFFGLAAGIVGDLITRVYILDNVYNLPFFGEINFSNGAYRGSSIIIRDPRKVVIEQNDKVSETVNAVKSSLVGIYAKIPNTDSKNIDSGKQKEINLSDYYKIGQEVGQGLIITSDGWIVTSFKAETLNYVVITGNNEIYQIDKVEKDTLTPFYFLHVAAKDLPVRKLAERSEINNGQLILKANWRGEVDTDIIINANETENKYLFFSDAYSGKIAISNPAKDKFKNSFLFNLSGDVIGIFNAAGEAEPIYHFNSAINTLLKNKFIMRPSFGANYIDLSKLVYFSPLEDVNNKQSKGAVLYKNSAGIAVIKNSAAFRAGLTEGDVIISIEGTEINGNNNLTDVIQNFSAGDKIKVVFKRGDVENEVSVVLDKAQ